MEILRSLVASDRAAADVARGLDVVCKLLENIACAPGDPRYRRIRKGNPRIAPLLGREEEGLLRAAGFEDADDDALACSGLGGGGAQAELGVALRVREVLDAADVARAVLREKLAGLGPAQQAAAEGGLSGLLCQDVAVAQALDCALLDYVTQQSADLAEAEKRRRRSAEADAVRSAQHWRAAFDRMGGSFLCDGGALEAWLESDASHRSLAHDLLQLQAAAMRWYGSGARRYCGDWRARLRSWRCQGSDASVEAPPGAAAPAAPPYGAIISKELQALREAIFEFPEMPGATPRLFRVAAVSAAAAGPGAADVSKDCMFVAAPAPRQHGEGHVVVALE